MHTDLCLQPATAIARLIRQRAVSASEVLEAHLARIEKINPLVNAIITLDVEGARDRARAIDKALARGEIPARWPAYRWRTKIWPKPKACAPPMARRSSPILCPISTL